MGDNVVVRDISSVVDKVTRLVQIQVPLVLFRGATVVDKGAIGVGEGASVALKYKCKRYQGRCPWCPSICS